MIKYPITVNKIEFAGDQTLEQKPAGRSIGCGSWVAVRPCDEDCKGKTYLGIYLGDMALSQGCSLAEGGTLTISRSMHNPAMYVPDLKRVVFGCGSYWKRMKSPDDLNQITDKDINDTWYVRALNELSQEIEG